MTRKLVETGEGCIELPQDIVLDKDGKLSPSDLAALNNTLAAIVYAINGGLTFGTRRQGARAGNFFAQYIETVTPAANTEFQVDHDLKRVALGVIPVWQDKAGSIYTSRRDGWGDSRVFLKGSAATMTVGLLVI